MRRVWVGCSGWNYPHWRGTVYPKGLPARRWVGHYATLFGTVGGRIPDKDAAEPAFDAIHSVLSTFALLSTFAWGATIG